MTYDRDGGAGVDLLLRMLMLMIIMIPTLLLDGAVLGSR